MAAPGKPYLFRVSNHHTPDCGDSPRIQGDDPNCYFGYFENEHGEQAVFVYDRRLNNAVLWLGDAGWAKPYTVMDGEVEGLTLSAAEQAWVRLCWKTATGFTRSAK